jgi:hypothetical protein
VPARDRGDNPERLKSEAGFAMLCGAAPIPASSGKTERHRLNRGGDRRANSALHMVVVNRLRKDDRTKAYVARRLAEGLTQAQDHALLENATLRGRSFRSSSRLDKHESVQGTQYTSFSFGRRLREPGILPSMRRTGTPADNAVVESLFDTMKLELLVGARYRTREEAKAATSSGSRSSTTDRGDTRRSATSARSTSKGGTVRRKLLSNWPVSTGAGQGPQTFP